MDTSRFRRSTNIEDDRRSAWWEEFNNSFLGDLLGYKQAPITGPFYPLQVSPDVPHMGYDLGSTDLDYRNWADDSAEQLLKGK